MSLTATREPEIATLEPSLCSRDGGIEGTGGDVNGAPEDGNRRVGLIVVPDAHHKIAVHGKGDEKLIFCRKRE